MSNRPKPAPPEEEGAPAWMTTYADMITLVLTFFVLLFSFSTIDAMKWKEIVSSLSGTPFVAIQALDPGGTLPESIEIPIEQPTPTPAPDSVIEQDAQGEGPDPEVAKKFNELYERIKNHIEVNELDTMLNVTEFNDTIVLRMTNSALFDSAQIKIKPEAALILQEVCGILNEYTDLIQTMQIVGHTDNRPIHTARYESNWQLSTARATEVWMFCEKILEIDGSKIVASGRGEYHPVASNDTDEGREQNRRVEFIIESVNKK